MTILEVELSSDAAGERLDKALSAALPEVSRARLQALIAEGRLRRAGAAVSSLSAKALAGSYELSVPAALPAKPASQDLDLSVQAIFAARGAA